MHSENNVKLNHNNVASGSRHQAIHCSHEAQLIPTDCFLAPTCKSKLLWETHCLFTCLFASRLDWSHKFTTKDTNRKHEPASPALKQSSVPIVTNKMSPKQLPLPCRCQVDMIKINLIVNCGTHTQAVISMIKHTISCLMYPFCEKSLITSQTTHCL